MTHDSLRLVFPPTAAVPTRQVRTAKQIEASRRNGAKSRGPKTRRGKDVSRTNALRHGLYSQVLWPGANSNGDDRAYLEILTALLEEYQPQTQMALHWTEILASEHLHLRRLLRLREDLYCRGSGTNLQCNQPDQLGAVFQARQEEAAWRDLRLALERNEPVAVPVAEADLLAGSLVKYLEALDREICNCKVDAARSTDPVCGELLAELQQEQERLGLPRLGPLSSERIVRLIQGDEILEGPAREAWLVMLDWMIQGAANRVRQGLFLRGGEDHVRLSKAQALLPHLPTQEALDRCLANARAAVERTERRLSQACRNPRRNPRRNAGSIRKGRATCEPDGQS